MRKPEMGALLRAAPERSAWTESRMGRFLETIERERGIRFESYEDAWHYSVEHLEDFWERVWREFAIESDTPYTAVLAPPEPGTPEMPGAKWFPGARINYAAHIVRALDAQRDAPMLIARSQTSGSREWSGARLLDEIARIQQGLKRHGVKPGDRVVGYLPNLPETVAAYIATAGLGAIWCSVPPEMGPQSVLDRISQLDPAVIIAVDGYTWGSKVISRAEQLERIREALPDAATIVLGYQDADCKVPAGSTSYADFTAMTSPSGAVECLPVEFEYPLVILFSSGTTGKPKAIVHSHGGLLLEHFKAIGLHFDISEADRNFWFSTTGWMVWTLSVSVLLLGASMVLMDGDPNWPTLDGEWSQWAICAETKATYFTTGAAYLAASAHAGLTPGTTWDLGRLREIQCSGSPLAADVAAWVYDAVGDDLMLAPASGGTDICSGFLASSPLSAVYAGEMSCRMLGIAVDSWDPEGHSLTGLAGELVVTRPMPSMPAFFWGDTDFARYRASYFDKFPGVWRHGDWLIRTERDSWVITGRSDATLNRGGVRLGTAEFYAVLDPRPGVADSMVLHFEDPAGGMGKLVLLLVPSDEGTEDEAQLSARVRTAIRTELSPRHVPDSIVFVPSVARTATGKRLEIPVKRLVQGNADAAAIDLGVLVHPEHIDEIIEAVRAVL
jgi:acetoacetyl-CoA synthetase